MEEREAVERKVLLELFDECGGKEWTKNENWLSNKPISEWQGVRVNRDGAVDRLDMRMVGMTGTLPASIGQLEHLKLLDVGYNDLTGSIPSTLGNCTQLRVLELFKNQFIGSFPETLGNCVILKDLNVGHNKLTGSLPVTIGNCAQLIKLDISHNQFTGSIPESIGKLINLTELFISSNKFDELLPATIGNYVKLTTLNVRYNKFTGSIPMTIGNCVQLTKLDISHNQFTGSIPESIGNLAKLTSLRMSSNKISGTIPDSFGKLTLLRLLDISNNMITGQWPMSMMACSSFLVVEYSHNEHFDYDAPYVWKQQITDLKLQPVVSMYQVFVLISGAVLGYVDVIADGISAAVFFSNEQYSYFGLQLFLMFFPLVYIAVNTPELSPINRLCILLNISLGIETYKSIQGRNETSLFISLKYFEAIAEACPSTVLQLDFVLSSSSALNSPGSSFILFSVAMSILSISLTFNKIVAVLPDMEKFISSILCLLYHCAEIIYRLTTFTAMFVAVGKFGLVFVLIVFLLRVLAFWLTSRHANRDDEFWQRLMTRSLILTLSDVFVHEKDHTPLFQGSVEMDSDKEYSWLIQRIGPHVEAAIAFATLFWHLGQDVTKSRRRLLVYFAFGALVVKELLYFDRTCNKYSSRRPLNKLLKVVEVNAVKMLSGLCYASNSSDVQAIKAAGTPSSSEEKSSVMEVQV